MQDLVAKHLGLMWYEINLEAQKVKEGSIFKHYQQAFKLRKELDISFGKIKFLDLENDDTIIYRNKVKDGELLVISNFRGKDVTLDTPINVKGYDVLLTNYEETPREIVSTLKPYQSVVYYK